MPPPSSIDLLLFDIAKTWEKERAKKTYAPEGILLTRHCKETNGNGARQLKCDTQVSQVGNHAVFWGENSCCGVKNVIGILSLGVKWGEIGWH